MISTIRFEAGRIFTKPTIISFTILLIASLYFTHLGISEYNHFFEEKKAFSAGEVSKTEMYMTYEQYGVTGLRVTLQPPALSVFFNRNDFVKNIEAIIDTSEVVKIFSNRKGRKTFSADGRFGDLNQIVAIFGALIMGMMGFLTVPNRHTLDFFGKAGCTKTIVSWLFILDGMFLLILAINYGFAVLKGISFTGTENRIFLYYGLIILPFLNLFYVAGLLVKALFNFKKSAVPVLLAAWFVLVFALPEAGKLLRANDANKLPPVENLELEKMKVLLDAERKGREHIRDILEKNAELGKPELKEIAKKLFDHYMNNGYLKNKQKEEAFLRQVRHIVDSAAKRSLFSPVDYLNMVSAEASGKGCNAYLDFLDYVLRLRDAFIRFYGEKRYGPDEERPISFIQNEENIYRSPARMPQSSTAGTAFITFYIVVLSAALIFVSRRKKIVMSPPAIPGDIKRNYMLFLLVNKEKQETLFKALEQEHSSVLDTASHMIVDGAVTVRRFIDFACRRKKVKKETVRAYLERLNFQENARLKLSAYPEEEKKKLICAIVFAVEKTAVIVINDFLNGVSDEFERIFLDLAAGEVSGGRRLIYVSSHMYAPASSFIKKDVMVKNYQPFQLEPQKVSLR
jgi:hypothetical protein